MKKFLHELRQLGLGSSEDDEKTSISKRLAAEQRLIIFKRGVRDLDRMMTVFLAK